MIKIMHSGSLEMLNCSVFLNAEFICTAFIWSDSDVDRNGIAVIQIDSYLVLQKVNKNDSNRQDWYEELTHCKITLIR